MGRKREERQRGARHFSALLEKKNFGSVFAVRGKVEPGRGKAEIGKIGGKIRAAPLGPGSDPLPI